MNSSRHGDRNNEGVAAVDRALVILTAFTAADRTITLAELARRTGLYKSTILRLANSLLSAGFIERLESGHYRLGASVFRLGTVYQRMLGTSEIIMPLMRALADESGESVAFYVRSGAMRTCLCRIDSNHPLRYSISEGDSLPLTQGSGGRVIAAFSEVGDTAAEQIRRDGFFLAEGDRNPEIVGISAPVFGANDTLVGALTVAGPRTRFDRAAAIKISSTLLEAAKNATRQFGGTL